MVQNNQESRLAGVLGHSLVRSFVQSLQCEAVVLGPELRLHHSLVCLLRTAHSARSFAHFTFSLARGEVND